MMPMVRLFMMLLVIPSGISKRKGCVFEYAYTYIFNAQSCTVIMNTHFDVLQHMYHLSLQWSNSAYHRTPCFSYIT